jgi:hypothetical protein
MDQQRLLDKLTNPHARIQRGVRVLEIIWTSRLTAMRPALSSAARLRPPMLISPEYGASPAIALAVVDLPHPDSPTSETVSWGAMSKLTPSTA